MINITIEKRHVYALVALIVAFAVIVPTASWASHTFTDVPDDNTFHADIDWLAAAGVTKGCNPPANTEYCPDDFVTRATMAAFLKRLAEAEVVDAATANSADDADLLDGYHATDLTRLAFNIDSNDVDNWDGSSDQSLSATITAPTSGYLLVNWNVNLAGDRNATGTNYHEGGAWIEIDDVLVGEEIWWTVNLDASSYEDQSVLVTRVIEVAAGEYEVTGQLDGGSATDLIYIYDRALNVEFIPFGSDGSAVVAGLLNSGTPRTQGQP